MTLVNRTWQNNEAIKSVSSESMDGSVEAWENKFSQV